MTVAAGSPEQKESVPKENLFVRLFKPLRDFGFGRVSLWEGGVGLFVFAGIGTFISCAVSLAFCELSLVLL